MEPMTFDAVILHGYFIFADHATLGFADIYQKIDETRAENTRPSKDEIVNVRADRKVVVVYGLTAKH